MRLPTHPLFIFFVCSWLAGLAACDDGVKVTDSCGDDFIDPGEACDGSDLGGATCADHGFYAGTLGCRANCTVDTSGCSLTCGDGVAQVGHEDCDRVDLQGKTCVDLGFSGGTLDCAADCTFDYSACAATCGDGIVALTEGCDDGARVAGDGCNAACQVEDGWTCAGNPSACEGVCGDGVQVADEACDDGVNDGGYGGCMPGCGALAPYCGDGERQAAEGELCDGADTGGVTCASSGFFGGPIACHDTCDQIDLSRCVGRYLGSYATGSTGADTGVALTADPQGNVIVAGIYQNDMNLHQESLPTALEHNIFLVKYDTSGNSLWVRTFGGTGTENVLDVATDSHGNIWMTGYFSGTVSFGGEEFSAVVNDIDIFLVKLDPDGQHLLSFQFGTLQEEKGTSLAVDVSDAVWLTGTYRAIINFGGGNLPAPVGQDLFLARFDDLGVHQRSFAIRGVTDTGENVRGLAVDQSNNAYLTGGFKGGLYVNAQQVLDADEQQVFVLKFNQVGVLQWGRSFGSPTFDDMGYALYASPTGSLWVTGMAGPGTDFGDGPLPGFGGGDVFVTALDNSGNPLWGKLFGSSGDDFGGTGLAPDAQGNLWLGGAFGGAADFGTGGQLVSLGIMDAFIALIPPGGDPWFALGFGGTSFDSIGGLVRLPSGRVFVTGGFSETMALGDEIHVSQGSSDYFMAFFE